MCYHVIRAGLMLDNMELSWLRFDRFSKADFGLG